MKKSILFCLLIFSLNSFAQQDTISFDKFYISFQGNLLRAFDNNNKIFYQKRFNNPEQYTADLNDDNIDEYLVLDSTLNNNIPGFTLYIYNTKDNFSFIDSILSGSTEPLETTNGDLGGTIIIAGNPDFEKFNQNNDEITFFL